jgi:PKD repeat protein
VTVLLNPSNCGSVTLNSSSEFSGATVALAPGIYPLSTFPCQGESVVGYGIVGNISVLGGEVYVNGSGSITVIMEPVPPAIVLDLPSTSTAGLDVPMAITVGELIPPYNYTYSWNFGDGSTATTTQNSTSHPYGTAGSYRVSVSIHDPLGRTASANATVRVESVAGTAAVGFLLPAIGAIGLAALVIGLAWYFSGPGAGRPPEEESTGVAFPSSEAPEESADADLNTSEPFPKEP